VKGQGREEGPWGGGGKGKGSQEGENNKMRKGGEMQDPREEEEGKRSRRSQRRDHKGPEGSQNILSAQVLGVPNSQSVGKPRRLEFGVKEEKRRWRGKEVMRSSHVSRKVTKSQSGGKPVKVRNRVRGRKERVGKTSDEYHHMVSHKATLEAEPSIVSRSWKK